jgi:hypothetical protein
MNIEMRVLLTQVMGLAVLLLGNLGIELSAEDKLVVINGLTALGLMLSSLVAYWPKIKAFFNRPDDGQNSGV